MRTSTVVGAATLALLAAAGLRAAEPIDSQALDRQISQGLMDAHNRGADLYNSGSPNDCYRMLQGALMTARPLLGHHPDLQATIDRGMRAADEERAITRRAFLLHETIEQVRTALKGNAGTRPSGPGTSAMPPGGTGSPATPGTPARPMGGTPPGSGPGPGLGSPGTPSGTTPPPSRPMGTSPGSLPGNTGSTPPAGSGTAPKPPDTNAEVRGSVKLNGQPLAKASVTFISTTDETVLFSTVSDEAGAYKLTTVKPGTYRVVISATKDGRQLVPAKYSDRKVATLTVEVTGQPKVVDFNLTS